MAAIDAVVLDELDRMAQDRFDRPFAELDLDHRKELTQEYADARGLTVFTPRFYDPPCAFCDNRADERIGHLNVCPDHYAEAEEVEGGSQ